MVERGTVTAATLGAPNSIPSIYKFVFSMLKRKFKLMREKKAARKEEKRKAKEEEEALKRAEYAAKKMEREMQDHMKAQHEETLVVLERERQDHMEAERRHRQSQHDTQDKYLDIIKMQLEEMRKERMSREEAYKNRDREAKEERAREAEKQAELVDFLKMQGEELERERRAREKAERKSDKQADQFNKYVQQFKDHLQSSSMSNEHNQSFAASAAAHCRCHGCQKQSKSHSNAQTFVCHVIPQHAHQSCEQVLEFGFPNPNTVLSRNIREEKWVKDWYKVEFPEDSEDDDDDDDDTDDDDDFRATFLKDDGAYLLEAVESCKQQMSTEDIALLEHQPEDVEDNEILSLVLAKINVPFAGGSDEAKEEGNAYFKGQKFDKAIKCYTKSIDQSPTAAAYGNRAMAYLKLNKFVQAEEDCTEALDIDGNYFKAYARRAIARAKLGLNHKGALEDVEIALKGEPNCQEMKNLHTELKCTLSKGSSVERANDRNAKHCVENATQAKDEGNVYYKEQKFEEAIKCYTKSIDISPTAKAYANRAEAYMKLNKYAEVEEDCTLALKLDDKYFKVYARRAIARKSLRRNLEGALEDIESALLLEPTDLEMKQLCAEVMNLI